MIESQPPILPERDSGVLAAIEAAGGIKALARALGVNQAAVSRWTHIPAHQIIPIERTLGVPRQVLRPDLYEGIDCTASAKPAKNG
jgi:DNA-binding transcriptional regulator YdaS (Cro superfamily)